MRSMPWILRTWVALALFASSAPGGTLTSTQEARLHPAFRVLLHEALDANGQVQTTRPEFASERGAIIYTSDASLLRAAGIKVQSVYDGFVTAFVRPADLLELAKMEAVRFVDPGSENYPQMDISLAETGASLLHAGFINNTPYKGDGAIVLIYDTGIDWAHRDFRDPNDPTKSRILAIWDQSLTPVAGETSPAGFSYGVEYTKAQIENEIDGSPAGFVREADVHGHGTHVAGTAAGNGGADGGKYGGMAPLADIIVVKGGDGSFSENKMIDGLTYAQQKAAAFGKPIVVNWSIGGQTGPHDGTRAYEVAVNSFVSSPGRVVCISAGNDGGSSIHTNGSISSGASDTVRIEVPSFTPTSGTENDKFFLDVWFGVNPNVSVKVVSPTGISYVRNLDESGTGPDETDGTIDAWNYLSSLNLHRNIQVSIHDRTSATPHTGTWMVIISNGTGSSLNYDGWLTSKTVGNHVVTLLGGNTQKTLSMPGTSSSAITVASYVTRFSWPSIDGGQYLYNGGTDRVGDYSLFSSIGPTADGRQKPDISAPGENIVSSLSSSLNMSGSEWAVSPGGKHQVMQGTSMASPHVAGAAALLLASNPSYTADQIKALLVTTANGDDFASGLPNVIWGYGKMDVAEAMARSLNGVATVARSIISYDEPGSGFFWRLEGSSQYAVRFSSPVSGRLTGVQVNVYNQDVHSIAGSGSLVCEVFSDGGGSPGSRIGNAVQLPFSKLSPGTNNSIPLLSANADITAGTDYYVVLSVSSPGDTLIVLSDGSSSGTHSLTYNGVNWTALGRNFRFRPIVVSTSGATAVEGEATQPIAFELHQNYPNPFNPSTRITYSIPLKGHVSLKVFDVLGKEVANIVDGEESAGSHQVVWGGTNKAGRAVSSGVYFYRLESGRMTRTQKMILMK